MTITTKGVTVPAWAISILLPLIIVGGGYFIGINKISAQTETKIEHLHEEVLELKATKASDEKVDGVIIRLDDMNKSMVRIEDFILNQ